MLLGNDQVVYPVFQFLRNLSSEGVARLSVPLFFLIAGFLFFQASDFSWAFYTKKLKSRFRSLLIPYLFWNAFALVMYFFLQQVVGLTHLAYGSVPLIAQWNWMDYLRCFWDLRTPNYPLVYPLWFVRDLMLTMLLSPLLYLLMKRLKGVVVLLFLLCWTFGLPFSLTGINVTALFFFLLGGYLRFSGRNLVVESRRLFHFSLIAYPFLAVADALTRGLFYNSYLHQVAILVGVVFLINVVSYLLEHKRLVVGTFLPGASFFLFAAHEQLLSQTRKSLTTLLPPGSQLCDVLLYLLPMLFVIPVVLLIYYLLKKFFPAMLQVMVGAR